MTIIRRHPIQAEGRALSVVHARTTLTWSEKLLGGLLAGTKSSERIALESELENGFEELTVETRAVVLHRESEAGPFVFVDGGGGIVLFLGGEWLLDPTVVADDGFDPEDRWYSKFRLTRSPATGIVLQLEPIGAKSVVPEKTMADAIPYMGESYVLCTSLESLMVALKALRVPVPRPEVWPGTSGRGGG